MKNYYLLIIFTFIFLSGKGQNKTINNHGAWFIFKNQNYNITISDIVEVSENIDNLQAWKSYRLSSGEVFIPVAPEKWKNKMISTISLIKGNEKFSLSEELSKSVIVPWDDNINSAKNWGIRQNGEPFIASANYKGGDNVRVLIYKGYPILKVGKPCLNPVEPLDVIKQLQKVVQEEPQPTPVLKISNGKEQDKKIVQRKRQTVVVNNYISNNPRGYSDNYRCGYTTPVRLSFPIRLSFPVCGRRYHSYGRRYGGYRITGSYSHYPHHTYYYPDRGNYQRPRPNYQPHGSMSGGRNYTPSYNHGSMSGGRGTMSGGSGYGGAGRRN